MPDVQQIQETSHFTYNGKTYEGIIHSSTSIEPHYHWFYFKDEELIQKVQDCIGFKVENGVLHPITHSISYTDLTQVVQQTVQEFLEKKGMI